MPSPSIHDAVSAGVAPSARAAWNTMTAEPEKPTSTATNPATTAENDRSRNARTATSSLQSDR